MSSAAAHLPELPERHTPMARALASASPPWMALRLWLRGQNRPQVWLAQELGVSLKHLNAIMNGRATYSVETALKLERVTGTPARSWLIMQCDWELARARAQAGRR